MASINLSEFINNPYTAKASFDRIAFSKAVRQGIIYLDKIIDLNAPNHALPQQRENSLNFRNCGLGVFGYATMLMKMGLEYGSLEAIKFTDKLFRQMFQEAVRASNKLAKTFGTFPKYNSNLWKSKIITSHFTDSEIESMKKYGLRNCSLLSIAPTGTIATMLNESGGCEPEFAISYTRRTVGLTDNQDHYYTVYCKAAKEYKELYPNSELPSYFVSSADINPQSRVSTQAIMQNHVDTAISSTVNLPESCTEDEMAQIYLQAWKQGLKGLTIFRANCKRLAILTTGDKDNKEDGKIQPQAETFTGLKRGDIIECSSNLVGKKRKLISGCGSLHVLAYFDPSTGEMQEVYLNKGSTGGCVDADTEYFNGKEWKKISEYQEGSFEQVLQYHEDGSASLTYPIAYIVNENVKSLKRFSNQYGLDMVLSDDHRMYLYKNYRKYDMGIRSKLTSEIVSVKEYLSRSGSKERHVPTTFSFKTSGIPISDNLIRLLVSVYADGTFDGNKIIFSFKKERKKARLRKLLTDCDIGWTERPIAKTDYTHFYVHLVPSIREWFIDKQFTSKWYNCTDEQLKIIIDECIYWDGTEGIGDRSDEYFSSKKEEVDFIQFALTRLGFRATISRNDSPTAISYKVRWTKQNVHNLRFAKIEDYKTIDGRSYCFTVPSGLLVLRRNNKIFITGNCANFMTGLSRTLSLLCRAGVDVNTIKDQLDSTGACPSYAIRSATKHDTSKGSCCPMAVGNALVEMWEEMQSEIIWEDEEEETKEEEDSCVKKESENKKPILEINEKKGPVCPECGESLSFEGGCNICKSCGWSKCS